MGNKTQNLLQILFPFIIFTPVFHAASPNVVKSVPGFPGNLPFYLETGYVGVGDNEEVQLFYYFIKSERSSEFGPLMLWLTGGPGCSALSGLVLEIGPLKFNTSACNLQSKEPTFQLNPYSWTKIANVIFLDSPVGTGFSYTINQEGYYSDDVKSSRHIHQFLRKWLKDHDEFQNNPLFISGDSYSGMTIPIIVQEIVNGNKAGFQPVMNLQGYIIGNPLTSKKDSKESQFEYAHRVSLLSDYLYESNKKNCNGNYEDVDMENVKCARTLQAISNESLNYLLENWANDIQVRAALNIQEGTKSSWIRCNRSLAYEYNVMSTVGYHQNLTQQSIRVLIYSGDQDLFISYVGTLEWINMLNVSISGDWRPWFVHSQVAGYTTKLSKDGYHLTYATIKGGGHTAPQYKPFECFNMFLKWIAMTPL